MKKTALVAAACLFAPSPLLGQEAPRSGDASHVERAADRDPRGNRPGSLAENEFRDRVAEAIEMVEGECIADINLFCGWVTPGEGRLALCMRAHEDQLTRGCQSALQRVARNIRRAVDRIGETCWNEVRSLCGDTDKLAQCVVQKKGSLSSPCNTIVTALGQKVEQASEITPRVGMPVYGPDDKSLGQVAEVVRGTDGKVQSVQVDIGRLLGIGSKVVAIDADKIERVAGLKVHLSESELRSLPEVKKQ
jgi:Golgi apparatus protein 1